MRMILLSSELLVVAFTPFETVMSCTQDNCIHSMDQTQK